MQAPILNRPSMTPRPAARDASGFPRVLAAMTSRNRRQSGDVV